MKVSSAFIFSFILGLSNSVDGSSHTEIVGQDEYDQLQNRHLHHHNDPGFNEIVRREKRNNVARNWITKGEARNKMVDKNDEHFRSGHSSSSSHLENICEEMEDILEDECDRSVSDNDRNRGEAFKYLMSAYLSGEEAVIRKHSSSSSTLDSVCDDLGDAVEDECGWFVSRHYDEHNNEIFVVRGLINHDDNNVRKSHSSSSSAEKLNDACFDVIELLEDDCDKTVSRAFRRSEEDNAKVRKGHSSSSSTQLDNFCDELEDLLEEECDKTVS